MLERLFDPTAILIMIGCGLVAAVVGAIVAVVRGGPAGVTALQTGLLALAGAVLARSFISILLSLADDSREAGIVLGWGFFLWPGAIDTVAALFGAQLLTTPDRLLLIAVGVGAFCGLMDGVHRIREGSVTGVVTFVLDTTWALGGTTNGCLLHIVDTFAGTHQADGRTNDHRYTGGFHIKKDFAFTQGQVMSDNSHGPGTPLYAHERTHIRQNRAFGPLYPLSYLAWMIVMFVPSVIAAAIRSVGVGLAIQAWCYFNNPWEAWGYKVGQDNGAGARTGFGTFVWSDGRVVAVAAAFFAAVLAVTVLLVSRIWL